MIFKIPKKSKILNNTTRTVKKFALLPKIVYHKKCKYIVWFEYFYQDEFFKDGTWVIQLKYPILEDVKWNYKLHNEELLR